jgi:hypothetical protein
MSETSEKIDRFTHITTTVAPNGGLHFTKCPRCQSERVGYRDFQYTCSVCKVVLERDQLELGKRIV